MTPEFGPLVSGEPANRPRHTTLTGRTVTLVPLSAADHAEALFEGSKLASLWDYLADGPYSTVEAFSSSLAAKSFSTDPLFFAILDKVSGKAVGSAAFLRIDEKNRVIEVGHILYTPALQRTVAGTEAMYLMMRHVFDDLGYRRYEWKCNHFNQPSRKAALRYGFTFEGIFRQHMIAKGRNRDTAWYSMLDSEWPERKAAFEAWLRADNFDEQGRQRVSLSSLIDKAKY